MDAEFILEIPAEETFVLDVLDEVDYIIQILDTIIVYMKFKLIPGIVGDIDGSNVTFVSTVEIEQIFKNGVLLTLDAVDGYTLSVDKKTATLAVVPDPAFEDGLQFYGSF